MTAIGCTTDPSKNPNARRLLISGEVFYHSAPFTFAVLFLFLLLASARVDWIAEPAQAFVAFAVASAWMLMSLRIGLSLLHRGRRLLVPRASELLDRDGRPPVLYLRSFRDDSETHRAFDAIYSRMAYYTEEEELAHAFGEVGPFVAVGEPGEELPALGAARFHFTDEEWRERVTQLVQCARLVILRARATPGLTWEVETVLKELEPERLLLVVGSRESYESFRKTTEKLFPNMLPELVSGSRMGSMRAFIAFDRDFRPRVLPLRRSCLRWTMTHPYLAELTAALRPLFAERALPSKSISVSWMKVAGLAIAGLMVLIALFR